MAEPHEPSEEPDWRRDAAYNYTDAIPRRAWAWEILRRNRDYQETWSEACTTVRIERPAHNLTVMTAGAELADMARWGLFFRRSATAGRGLGRRLLGPGACAHVLPTIACRLDQHRSAQPFCLSDIPCHATVLLTRMGCNISCSRRRQ